ncbi:MAG: aminotransferase class V-fold PLP-dependent enzyme [Phycisphaerales bacterium]|jgi:isopenicillin-N epimerase
MHAATAQPALRIDAGPLPFASPTWNLDPSLTYLNHGSYGAVLQPVLDQQAAMRARMERDSVRFFKADLEGLTDQARAAVADFAHCRPADLCMAPNATIALATILYNVDFRPGDEVLVCDHDYSSILYELDRVCARTGAVAVKAAIPFPISSQAEVAARFLACVTPRTRLAFIPHITSATSLIFPVAEIVAELNRRGIDVVVDAAHSPGQLQIDIQALNPTYWVGSGHKWLSAPKGTGFMYVRSDKQPGFRTLALSSRAGKIRPDRSLFLRDFDYMGTADYTPILAIPQTIRSMGELLPGGWPALMRRNHETILKGRDVVCRALGIAPPAPDTMVGSMVTLPLPAPAPEFANRPTKYDDALQDNLLERHKVVAPIWRWGPNDMRVIRISAQLYNTAADFETLAGALVEELRREKAIRATA